MLGYVLEPTHFWKPPFEVSQGWPRLRSRNEFVDNSKDARYEQKYNIL